MLNTLQIKARQSYAYFLLLINNLKDYDNLIFASSPLTLSLSTYSTFPCPDMLENQKAAWIEKNNKNLQQLRCERNGICH